MNTELLRALRAKLVSQLAAVDTLLSDEVKPVYVGEKKRIEDGKDLLKILLRFIGEGIKTRGEINEEIVRTTGRSPETAQSTGGSFISRHRDLFDNKEYGKWALTQKGLNMFKRLK